MKNFFINFFFIILSIIVISCDEGYTDEADTFTLELKEVTAVPSITSDTTPDYTFYTNMYGSVSYGGACSSSASSANSGNNKITLNTLSNGTYSNCTITLKHTDSALVNTLAMTSFTVDTSYTGSDADTTAPNASVTTATITNSGNAVVQSTETGTVYLVDTTVTVINLASITGAADNQWNSVAISSASTNTNLSATGLGDGIYKVYAVDDAGNLSSASSNSVTIDTTAPAAFVSSRTITNTDSATVQITEAGTAYLVNTNVSVSNLASITGAADNQWNSVAISYASILTNLAATGLGDGIYKVYAVDLAGNLSSASSNSVTVESSAPSVNSVAITSASGVQNDLLNTGDVVSVTITFSENVSKTGTPQVTLVVGSTPRPAAYASGSGSTALVFQYTIQAGETDSDGISINANALALNSGTIRDAAGNNSTLTHNAVSANSSYKVDTTAPTANFTAATDDVGTVQGALSSGNTTDDTALVLSGSNESGSSVKVYNGSSELGSATVSGTSWSYTATVANGVTYQFNVRETDLAGNTSNATSNLAVTGDTIPLTVSSVAITGASGAQNNFVNAGDLLSVTVNFTENASVTGTPQLTLVVGSTPQNADYASGTGSSALVFQYTIQAGETDSDGISIGANALALNGGTIRDPTGNDATLTHNAVSANSSYKVDTTVPTVSSFTIDDSLLLVGETADVDLVFSEAVFSFSSADDITADNGSLATMTSGDNRTWSGTFTPSTNTEDANNALSLATSYTDLAGNPGPAETTSNYAVETQAPTVSSFTLSDSALKAGDNATVTLVFSEAVASFSSADDITVNNGSLTTMTSSDNITWAGTFTPAVNTEDATNILSLATSYTDPVGNAGAADNTSNYAVETYAPTITGVAITGASGAQNNFVNAGDNVSVTVTFRESVIVDNASGTTLTLNIGGVSKVARNTSGSGSSALVFQYTIQAGETDSDGISINADSLALPSSTIRDPAGNNATLTHLLVSSNDNYKVDTTAPTASWGAATDDVGAVTGTLSSGNTTDDTVLRCYGTNGSSSSVKVYNGSTELGSATVIGNSWSYDATVANGTTYQFNAKETDLAGNTSNATSNFAITGDTTAPTANFGAATDDVGTIQGALYTGNTTDDTALVLSGSNESGSVVKVYNSTTELDNATVSGTSWSYTATVANGTTYQFNVKETDLAGNTSSATSNFAVTGDTTPPTVSSAAITGASGDQNNFVNAGDVVSVTVNFSESVNVDNASGTTLTLNIGGVSKVARNTSGSGSSALVFQYTIQAGETDSDGIRINADSLALPSSTIRDPAGNNATLTHNLVSDNDNYKVDTTAPTVNPFSINDQLLLVGETARVDLVFSEAVISFSSDDDITASNGTLATMTSDDNRTWVGTFTPTANREVANNALSLATSYTDPAGNAGASANTSNYAVETYAPTINGNGVAITDAVGDQNNFVNAGDNVSITVTFRESVIVDNASGTTLALNIGGASKTATYASGSGSTALVFQYTILAGETDTDGISIDGNSLAVVNGTIRDAAGNNATITHNSVPRNSSYMVDTTPPTVSSVAITSASGAQNNFVNAGDRVYVTTTFSENVNRTGSPQQTMVIGSTNRPAAYNSLSGRSMVFRYDIVAGQAAENDDNGIHFDNDTLALNGGTISDPAGNNAILNHNSVPNNTSYMVDTIHPTVNSFTITSVGTRDELLLVGQTAAVQLVFSEIIWSNTFHNNTGSNSSRDITVSSGSLSTMTSGDGITWNGTFTPSSNTDVATNALSLGTNYTDPAGNAGPSVNTSNYEVDTIAPSASFTFTDVYMKNGETSDVTLTFNEPVLDFSSADDITIPNLDNGTPSGTLATMTSGDNRTWRATFTPTFPDVQDWTNTLSLGTGYRDYDNNTGTAATSPNYMVDDIDPVENGVPTLSLNRSLFLYGQTATLTLVFPEPVTSSTFSSSSDILLDNATGALSNMSTSNGGTIWTGTFTATNNREVPSNTIFLKDTWEDQVGNPGLTAITSSYEVETLRPFGTFSFSVAQTNPYDNNSLKPGDNASVTLVFNEEVFNFASADDILHPNVNLSEMTSDDNITFTGSFTPMDNIADYTNVLSLSGTFNDFKGNSRGSGSSANYIVNTKAPTVTSMKLTDGVSIENFNNSNICLPVHSNFKVIFDDRMEPSFITTTTSPVTSGSNCAGSIQVSSDNFSTCVEMSSEPSASTTSNTNDTYTLNPDADLAYGTTYKIKVTTAAKDVLRNSLSSQYDHAYEVTTSSYPSSSPSSGFFVAVGADGKGVRSINDGASWDNETCQMFTDLYGVTSGNNTVVAVGQGGKIIRSTDNASSFSIVSPYYDYDSWGVTFGNNTFVGVNNSGRTGRSINDGSSFSSAVYSNLNQDLRGIAFGNNTFVAVADDYHGRIVRSTNGTSWSSVYTDTPRTYLYGITYGDSKFVAVGASGRTQRSTDNGTSWDHYSSGAGTTLNGVAFGNNTFVAVGVGGKIMTSSNGSSWTLRSTPIVSELKGVAFGNSTFVAVGVGGKILRSTDDGVNWSDVTSPITTDLNGVTFSD